MQQTRRSITNLGDLQRFGRFLAKLRAGEPVTVAGIGSSVTVDFAVRSASGSARCRAACVERPARAAAERDA